MRGLALGLSRSLATGASGIIAPGNSFDPSNYGELALWLEADTLTLNEGDQVETWSDSTTPSRYTIQNTAANRPLFRLNIINGLPVVRFDGVNDMLLTNVGSATVLANTDVTYVAVVSFQNTGTNQEVIYLGNFDHLSPQFHNMVLSLEGSQQKTFFNQYDGSEHRSFSNNTITFNHPYLLIGERRSGVNYLYVNGVLQSGSLATGNPSIQPEAVVKIGGNGAWDFLNGDVAVIGAYAGSLTEENRGALVEHLIAKYNITTPPLPQVSAPTDVVTTDTGDYNTLNISWTPSADAYQTGTRLVVNQPTPYTIEDASSPVSLSHGPVSYEGYLQTKGDGVNATDSDTVQFTGYVSGPPE